MNPKKSTGHEASHGFGVQPVVESGKGSLKLGRSAELEAKARDIPFIPKGDTVSCQQFRQARDHQLRQLGRHTLSGPGGEHE